MVRRAYEPTILKRIRNQSAYFTVRWSRLWPAEKHLINDSVPSVGGIYELYLKDKNNTLNLLGRGRAYYAGLRNTLRDFTDPLFPRSLGGKPVPQDKDLVFRYSCTTSHEDMSDVLFFFAARTAESSREEAEPSGRYEMIYVNEVSRDRLVTI